MNVRKQYFENLEESRAQMVDPLATFSYPPQRQATLLNGYRVWALSAVAATFILCIGFISQEVEQTELLESEISFFVEAIHEPAWNPESLLTNTNNYQGPEALGLMDWLES